MVGFIESTKFKLNEQEEIFPDKSDADIVMIVVSIINKPEAGDWVIL